LQADLIILGPGSLYTSVLPNLLIPEIHQALRASRAFKVYVCNVVTQRGETDGYSAEDHVRALEAHLGPGSVDVVLISQPGAGSAPEGTQWVVLPDGASLPIPRALENLIDAERPGWHDSKLLADCLMTMLEEHTGPLDSFRRDGEAKEEVEALEREEETV
jgi:uncharacterized cofD-like protein